MRRAFNLIELIFTIVIMAGIFAVIPKIIFATNKSDSFAMKQDALFNAISLTNIASLLAWDENNTDSSSILATSDNHIPCDTSTFLRAGGFLGEHTRNCKEIHSASAIGNDGETVLEFDDIDDFNGSQIDVNLNTTAKYRIYTDVRYLSDNIFSPVVNNKMTITLDNSIQTNTSNIKKFKATVGYVGGRGKDKNISSFYYYSTNIGQITLNSEEW
jgi:hypothetical protein